jgi:hypothetical protein
MGCDCRENVTHLPSVRRRTLQALCEVAQTPARIAQRMVVETRHPKFPQAGNF